MSGSEVNEPGSAGSVETDQLAPDAHAEVPESKTVSGSLFEPLPELESPAVVESRFGVPGPELSHDSAFYRGLWGAVGVLLAIGAALALREVTSVLELVLISGFLAIGLNPIVELLIGIGLKRAWAVLVVALSGLAIVTVIVAVLVSVLDNQVTTFVRDAPHLLHDLLQHKTIANLNDRYHFITDLQAKLKDPELGSRVLKQVFSTGLGALQAAASTLVVFVLTLYFLAALPQLKNAAYSLAPASRRTRVGQLGDEILRRTGRFVVGAFLVALLAGSVTFIFLLVVGLGQYALPLALFVALLDLVPLVGSITGAVVVTLVCLATSLDIGIAAAIFYLIYEPLEGYVIYPRVMRSSVDVPEYVTVIAVLAGGAVGGVIGALLALPIAAAMLLLTNEVWIRRQDAK
ncbi:predicted PurR-regulated permease PerM [Jatrophihabitans sp. GAS493]|uniref:AI-2E family transporter n=1 Tax=Jatrophihabitans sp. GAS493 TaxID=1907575 RepID=UPI000BC09E2F|nr:AI-2E family transporter [Jatrophihabitans sp. GAS493]SOD73850.1 predicted PurR-regulated permease PerM [Jatrophihabitans sp. GAS493]